jgi:hypothetical protein
VAIRLCASPKNFVLVNPTFTKEPLGQRTRFFVAERRSSLPGCGALVRDGKAPLFFSSRRPGRPSRGDHIARGPLPSCGANRPAAHNRAKAARRMPSAGLSLDPEGRPREAALSSGCSLRGGSFLVVRQGACASFRARPRRDVAHARPPVTGARCAPCAIGMRDQRSASHDRSTQTARPWTRRSSRSRPVATRRRGRERMPDLHVPGVPGPQRQFNPEFARDAAARLG